MRKNIFVPFLFFLLINCTSRNMDKLIKDVRPEVKKQNFNDIIEFNKYNLDDFTDSTNDPLATIVKCFIDIKACYNNLVLRSEAKHIYSKYWPLDIPAAGKKEKKSGGTENLSASPVEEIEPGIRPGSKKDYYFYYPWSIASGKINHGNWCGRRIEPGEREQESVKKVKYVCSDKCVKSSFEDRTDEKDCTGTGSCYEDKLDKACMKHYNCYSDPARDQIRDCDKTLIGRADRLRKVISASSVKNDLRTAEKADEIYNFYLMKTWIKFKLYMGI